MNFILLQQWIISLVVLSIVSVKCMQKSQRTEFDDEETLVEHQQHHHGTGLNKILAILKIKDNGSRKLDSSEVINDVRVKQDDARDDERGSTPVSTDSLGKDTLEVLEWLSTQTDANGTDGLDYTLQEDEDCYAYINASMLESLHALESEKRLIALLDEKFKRSCNDPCVNFNQSMEYESRPIVQECSIPVIININSNQKYEHTCVPQVHVIVNKPYFIRHKLYWCVQMKHSGRNRKHVRKHATDPDEKKQDDKLVLPHGDNRVRLKWSSFTNNCPQIDVRVDNKFFCEITANDTIPEPRSINDLDDLTQQLFLTEMIDNIIDYDRVVNHYRFQHCNAISFFFAHRRYLACVEKLLARKSLPLPMWSPQIQQDIPLVLQGIKFSPHACLGSAYCTDGWFDMPFDRIELNVNLPTPLLPSNICEQDFFSLHKYTMEYHRLVHNQIGGVFNSFDSPASPLFYSFHNYIDKRIFRVWEQCSDQNTLFVKKHMSSA